MSDPQELVKLSDGNRIVLNRIILERGIGFLCAALKFASANELQVGINGGPLPKDKIDGIDAWIKEFVELRAL
jgi:hypothetical protein